MIKQLFILFNLIGVVGFNFLFEENVKIEVKAPEMADPGSTVKVEVTINKGNIDGFAKFQQDFPEGLSAEKENTGDATFSFKDQQLKCIWMAIPESESFTIIYNIKIDPNASGEYSINGNFAYIENNEKKMVVIPPINMNVGNTLAMPEVTESEPPIPAAEEPIKASSPAKRDPENGVLCMRTISPLKGKQEEFKVEIKINSDKTGFAKIEEYIPEGFVASEIESMEGIFSFKNQVVKIIWMSLPEEEEFNVAYSLKADGKVSGNQKVKGNFAYIEGNTTMRFELTPSNIFIERDADGIATIIIDDEGGTFKEKEVAAEFRMPLPEDDEVKTFESEAPEEVAVEEPEEVKEEPIAKVPEPESDVVYKVQVAAGHKSVSNDYFSLKYKLKEKVNIENHEGWIKYTVGSFTKYKQGRDHRNEIWNTNKINDAFVTAYNYGNRITVQEALMITNQKWYN